ncbi:MAG: hypothetical protein ACIPMY_00280 [Rickettsia endosymbiont of Pentastiridius leporinus]
MIELFKRFADNNTPMYFKDQKEPLSFDESIKMLCGDQSPNEKQEQILNSLKAYVENRATDEDKKVVAHFHNWAINIHNSNLTVPEGASGFPNNIVYSIIQAFRNSNSKDELTSEEVLMLFMLEGINARKISGGETPGTNFISTILLNQVLKSANFEDKKTQEFISKYGLDNDLVKQYNSFMSSHFKNSWINTLSPKKLLELEHQKNFETAANAYKAKEGIFDKELLQEFTLEKISKMSSELIESLKNQADSFKKLMPNLENRKISKAELVVLWDISEYLEKEILALKIANTHIPIEGLEELLNDPFIKEIATRNETGDYPVAKERAEDFAMISQVIELFQQEEIHNYNNEVNILGDE